MQIINGKHTQEPVIGKPWIKGPHVRVHDRVKQDMAEAACESAEEGHQPADPDRFLLCGNAADRQPWFGKVFARDRG